MSSHSQFLKLFLIILEMLKCMRFIAFLAGVSEVVGDHHVPLVAAHSPVAPPTPVASPSTVAAQSPVAAPSPAVVHASTAVHPLEVAEKTRVDGSKQLFRLNNTIFYT